MKLIFCFIFLFGVSEASGLKKYNVRSIQKMDKGQYKVGLRGYPGVYLAKKKEIKCLVTSYKNKSKISLKITKELHITKCLTD